VRTQPSSKTHVPRFGSQCAVEAKILEDGNIPEGINVRIEILIVENTAGLAGPLLAEDPFAAGMLKGLRRLAFNDVAQRLLAAIGLREVELVEHEERNGQDRCDGYNRHGNAVEADACGFHGGQLAVAVHDAEDHQHTNEDAERGDEVDHAGGEIDEVLADRYQGSSVPDDVAQQLEEGEDEHEHDKCNEHHDKCGDKLTQYVLVEDQGETAAGQALADWQADGSGRHCGFFGAEAKPVAEGRQRG